jgi:hypothetical protein
MDVIDLEDDEIDAEVLNSMSVTQVRQMLCSEVQAVMVLLQLLKNDLCNSA